MITCSSPFAMTLSAQVNDSIGGLATSQTHLFDRPSGVQSSTEYKCTIALYAEGSKMTSAESAPVFVTTITVLGTVQLVISTFNWCKLRI